jgi:hypothetical protein
VEEVVTNLVEVGAATAAVLGKGEDFARALSYFA